MHILSRILGIAIPLAGVFWLGWTVGTLVILFWFDAFLACLLQCLRIRWHERLSGDPLHRSRRVFSRWGRWTFPPVAKRYWVDYSKRTVVMGIALGAASVLVPFLYAHEHPAQAALMKPNWDGVALGASAALVLALMEVPLQRQRAARLSFAQLHDVASSRMVLMAGFILALMALPLLAEVIDSPIVLLLAMIAAKIVNDLTATAVDPADQR